MGENHGDSNGARMTDRIAEENRKRATEGFTFSLKEFKAEWHNLKQNVDLLLEGLDSGIDPERTGTVVKISSYRLSILSAEIMAFHKRMNR